MKVLGKGKRKKEDYKLVGASVSSQVNTYITLYCLSHGISKSQIIKDLLDEWILKKRRSEALSEEALSRKVVRKCVFNWKTKKAAGRAVSQRKFMEDLYNELMDRGVPEPYLTDILKGVEIENEKNWQ